MKRLKEGEGEVKSLWITIRLTPTFLSFHLFIFLSRNAICCAHICTVLFYSFQAQNQVYIYKCANLCFTL